jgi:hypothetical protein
VYNLTETLFCCPVQQFSHHFGRGFQGIHAPFFIETGPCTAADPIIFEGQCPFMGHGESGFGVWQGFAEISTRQGFFFGAGLFL